VAQIWGIRCYIDPEGVDKIREWFDGESKKVRAKFHSQLRTLSHLPLDDWRLPVARRLHGDCVPLVEVRFKVDNVQHRPLGFRGPGQIFTLTFCATEKGGRFVPPKCLRNSIKAKTGNRRK